jgi:lysophospholipase L1-like esterase
MRSDHRISGIATALMLLAVAAPARVVVNGPEFTPTLTACQSTGGPTSFDNDGRADVAGIDAHHDLRLYTGDGHGNLSGGALMWPAGGRWNGFTAIAAADFNGDGNADLAGIDAYADMRMYTGDGHGNLSGGVAMWPTGGLWNGFVALAAADFNGDGNADIAGIDAHHDLRLYTGDGRGNLSGGALMWPAGGLWNGFTAVVAADFGGDGLVDVAGIDAHGDIRLYTGDGQGRLTGGSLMWPGGGQWSGFSHIATGDFNGDANADIAGIDANHDLRLYTGDGTGHLMTGSGGLMWPGGGLWNGFTQIVSLPRSTCVPVRTAILPLGDSITDGVKSGTGNGYRGYLANRFTAGGSPMGTGWLYEGGLESGSLFWSHEGHSGNTIDQIAAFVPSGLAKAPNGAQNVDLVLLDAGTNDDGQNRTATQMIADTSTLLDKVLGFSPSIRVVLAQITVTTRNTATQQQTERDFDDQLPALAEAKGARVAVVDMRGVHLSVDGIHPDDAGYQDMANRWYATLASAGWLP